MASAVRTLMTARTVWTGTASELLDALGKKVSETVCKAKTWPTTPRAFSGRLRRAATFLRKIGIDIEFTKEGRARTRIIRVSSKPEDTAMEPSAPSAPSADSDKSLDGKGNGEIGQRTVVPPVDAKQESADGIDSPTVLANPLNSRATDGADGTDEKIPADSTVWGVDL